ncbi:hypothetical protein MAL1_00068 [Bacteriophage DSS3_MAL1]|nr:hypothetical protein MAL1_00068 [Bacteriophage DSS3_MAL1]
MDLQNAIIAGTDAAHDLSLREPTADVLTALEQQLRHLLGLVLEQQGMRSAS